MQSARGIVGILMLMLASLPGASLAEHEVDHRYTIRGYVLDARDAPVAGSGVSIRYNSRTIGAAKTDADGYYSIQVHLHDDALGRELLVNTAGETGAVRVTLTAGDRTTQRIHHVNFIGDELVEGELPRRGLPGWAYLAGAAVLLISGTIAWRRHVRRRLKRAPVAMAREPSVRAKRKKRRKR